MESVGDDGGLQREHGKMESVGNDNSPQMSLRWSEYDMSLECTELVGMITTSERNNVGGSSALRNMSNLQSLHTFLSSTSVPLSSAELDVIILKIPTPTISDHKAFFKSYHREPMRLNWTTPPSVGRIL
jgi:hypothetical protein